mgnify:CR=1 FL=1
MNYICRILVDILQFVLYTRHRDLSVIRLYVKSQAIPASNLFLFTEVENVGNKMKECCL